MAKNGVTIYVSPKFRKEFKKIMVELDKNCYDLSDELSDYLGEFKEKRGKKYAFRF